VAKDGSLSIERGSTFHNSGTVMNEGYLLITDGGQLNIESGSLTNNGTRTSILFSMVTLPPSPEAAP
jgi:hypothetical protein